jgi:ribosomal protein S18 acetylase RimI-like enzyme
MNTATQWDIRLAQPEEAHLLVPLIQALAHEEGSASIPSPEKLVPLIQKIISEGIGVFFLAVRDGQAFGCLQLNYRFSTWATTRYAYLEDFYVAPHARGAGIGTAMIRAACSYAAQQGCRYVDLDARLDNGDAARLYQRLGFQQSSSVLWRCPLENAELT